MGWFLGLSMAQHREDGIGDPKVQMQPVCGVYIQWFREGISYHVSEKALWKGRPETGLKLARE